MVVLLAPQARLAHMRSVCTGFPYGTMVLFRYIMVRVVVHYFRVFQSVISSPL